MDSSAHSFNDALFVRCTVEDFDTFRYVLVRRPQVLLLTSTSYGHYRESPGLFDSRRIRTKGTRQEATVCA